MSRLVAVLPVALVAIARTAVALAVAIAIMAVAAIPWVLAVVSPPRFELLALPVGPWLDFACVLGASLCHAEVLAGVGIWSVRGTREGLAWSPADIVAVAAPTAPAAATAATAFALGPWFCGRAAVLAALRTLRCRIGAAFVHRLGLDGLGRTGIPFGFAAHGALAAGSIVVRFAWPRCCKLLGRRGHWGLGPRRGLRGPFLRLPATAAAAGTATFLSSLDRRIATGCLGLGGRLRGRLRRGIGGAGATARPPAGCRLLAACGSWILIEDACPKVAHGSGRPR